MNTENNIGIVAGLRELANHLERNPELAALVKFPVIYGFVHSGAEDFARLALTLGTSTKSAGEEWYNVERKFGPISFQVTARRSLVCERTVVATDEVEVEERDPVLVAAAIDGIPLVKTTKTVEKIEWVCPPSLGSLMTR